MPQAIQRKSILRASLSGNQADIRRVLRETAGLWRGRKINPIAYQRSIRKSYSTLRQK